MFKIQIIKNENGERGISLVFQTLKIKQKFSGLVSLVISTFRALRQYLFLKFKLLCLLFKILGASPQKILLKEEGNQTLLLFSREDKPRRKIFGFLRNKLEKEKVRILNWLQAIGKRFKKLKEKITEGVSLILILALVLQTFFSLINFTKANENNLCPVEVDVVLAMDTTLSMDSGSVPSKCDWENLEWVDNEYGGTYMCIPHTQNGLTESECQDKPKWSQCDDPVYTPAVLKRIEYAKEAANAFIDNLTSVDQSSLISFNNSANLVKNLSNNHSTTKTAINSLTVQSTNATNIGDAILAASDELNSERANPEANQVIILLTDGKANKPNGEGSGENQADIDYALAKAQEAASLGQKIFTIGFGSGVNQIMLQNIANLTGGQYYYVSGGSQLTSIYNQIYSQISWEECQYGSISGCKYLDSNADGNLTGEETLSDWEIILSGDAGATQLTDENGCYNFSGLLAGNYTVSEGENVGNQPYLQTFPQENSYNVILAKGENRESIDFANYLPLCGNQILDANFGEVCEIGDIQTCSAEAGYNGNQSCNNTCTGWGQCVSQESCGDGIKNGNEECDGIDGLLEHYSCSQFCTLEYQPYCGDGLKNQPIEECDSATSRACLTTGGYSGQQSCLDCLWSACQTQESCGDGIKNGQELCDDGNILDGDGCSTACQTESQEPPELACGNGILEQGEGCDDGNIQDGDGCSAACQTESQEPAEPLCGNGILEEGEGCDDGNSQAGDGCSASCQTEEQANQPNQEPSVPAGGGGTGHFGLYIHTQSAAILELEPEADSFSMTITWFTNLPTTSRVVYDLVPHSSLGSPPNYGYQWSTLTSDENPKVTYHQVEINGLTPGLIYYFRPLSQGSPEVFGSEIEYTMPMTTLEKTEENTGSATTTEITKEAQVSPQTKKTTSQPIVKSASPSQSGQVLGEGATMQPTTTELTTNQPKEESKTQKTGFLIWGCNIRCLLFIIIVILAILILFSLGLYKKKK